MQITFDMLLETVECLLERNIVGIIVVVLVKVVVVVTVFGSEELMFPLAEEIPIAQFTFASL